MQEILFRGKKTDSGEWVYGGYCHYDDSIDNGQDSCDYIIEKHTGEYFPFVKVIPETIGQYTGLTDKNGTKVFDGDVLKIKSEDYDYKYTTKVYYNDHTLCVDVEGQDYDYTAIGFADDIWNTECCEIEVIGNIYDNPELFNKA